MKVARINVLVSALLWMAVVGSLVHGATSYETAVIAGCAGLVSGMHFGDWCARRARDR